MDWAAGGSGLLLLSVSLLVGEVFEDEFPELFGVLASLPCCCCCSFDLADDAVADDAFDCCFGRFFFFFLFFSPSFVDELLFTASAGDVDD